MRLFAMIGLTAFAVGTLAAPASAQRTDEEWLERCRRGDYNDDRERFCEVRVERLRSTGALSVDGHRNGAVSVHGWDGDSIVVHARIQASARTEADARELVEDVRILVDGGRVSAEGPSTEDRSWWSVNFEIGVPLRTDLELEVYNGPLAVEEVSGRMDLTSRNGPLALDGVSGDVTARVLNGPLSVVLTGTRWEGAGLDAESTNGPAVISIPARYSAQLETGTTNGPMVIDYPLTLQGRIDRQISATLGEGGATVRVVTTNGPLHLKQR